jgi:beta-glucanase (GH16 family)
MLMSVGYAQAQQEGVVTQSAQAGASAAKLDLSQFKLTWQDEFNGDKLDPTKWEAPEMTRQGASRWVRSLVTVKDGALHLGILKTDDPQYRYNCGAVRTQYGYDPNRTMFQQQYGYFEARCKLPQHVDADYWGAFWMMAGSVSDRVSDSRQGTEIDIMESFNFAGKREHTVALHWNGYGKSHNAAGIKSGPHREAADGQFHTFGLYWDQQYYVAFLDGVEIGRTDMIGLGKDEPGKTKSQGTCQRPAYLKLTCEAAQWSGLSHLWEKDMPQQDEFVVDYVRVYEGKLPAPAMAGPAK